MAFNVNAQVVLSGPKNLNNVKKQLQSQLGQAGQVKVNVSGNAGKTFGTLNQRVNTLNSGYQKLNSSQKAVASQANRTNSALQNQARVLGGLGKRFSTTVKQAFAFGLVSRPVFELQRALSGAVKEAIKFERELVKISQVTGQSLSQLSSLQGVINNLSTSLGVNANELAETARIITQTGKSAQETEVILKALAKSTLAPTFGKITDTTEGLIAALGQFKLSASQSEAILGSLNAVSKNFAVEAEDLISVIRRAGGVFAQSAGQTKGTITALQELSAIFTSVRSTTRESADTIASRS